MIADADDADLGDLDEYRSGIGLLRPIPEPVGSDDDAGAQDAVRTDHAVFADNDVGPQLGVRPDGGLIEDADAGVQHAVLADGRAGPDDAVRADAGVAGDFGGRINHGGGVRARRRADPGRREEAEHLTDGQVGVVDRDYRTPVDGRDVEVA